MFGFSPYRTLGLAITEGATRHFHERHLGSSRDAGPPRLLQPHKCFNDGFHDGGRDAITDHPNFVATRSAIENMAA